MEFNGTRLSQKRLSANMSRADLAAAVRTKSDGRIKASEAGIRGWEKDKHTPGGEAVVAIAAALDCRVEDLYGVDDDDAEAASMPSYHELLAALRPLGELFARSAA